MRRNPRTALDTAGRPARIVVCAALLPLAAACGSTAGPASGGGPEIRAVAPSSAPLSGGSEVTITGSGLADGSGSVTVLFGTLPAEVASASGAELVVRAPAGTGCGAVDVQVVHAAGAASREGAFAYTGGTGPLQVDSIEPAIGAIEGGAAVTITGSGFTGGVAATIDGLPLEDVQVLDGSTITARTPVGVRGGAVDLAVRNCAGGATRADAFTYTTGLHGGLAALTRTDIVHPERFTGEPPDFVEGYLTLIEPHPAGLAGALPPPDTCAADGGTGVPPATDLVYRDAGPTVRLERGATLLDLPQQVEQGVNGTVREYFVPGGFPDLALYADGARYDVTIPGTASVQGFTAGAAITAPRGFQVVAPADLHVDPPPTYAKSAALAFEWTPPGPSDPASVLEIVVVGFGVLGQSTGERVRCIAADDGAFELPVSAWQEMPQAVNAAYFLRRRVDQSFPSPEDGSTFTTIAYTQEVGAFRLSP